ncbi:MAG: hypothetical protein ACE5F9_14015 [Phycisphaerae bacterium]
MELQNTTHLDTARLDRMFRNATEGWKRDGLRVFVRYSRGAAFSGTCFYKDGRVFINLGRDNRYPLEIKTNVARAQSDARCWWRELYSIDAEDAYQLVLFVFLHEFYHWLVRRARRNVRQKESRCDRFAVRWLCDRYGATVRDHRRRPVARADWDFQDLDGFVAAARRRRGTPRVSSTTRQSRAAAQGKQLRLF